MDTHFWAMFAFIFKHLLRFKLLEIVVYVDRV